MGLAPTGKRRLVTAHTLSGHSLALLHDFVGAREDRRWDGEADFFRGRKIDDQYDLARLQDRQIARLLARKNSARILSCDAVYLASASRPDPRALTLGLGRISRYR